jgi:hypothetical protein
MNTNKLFEDCRYLCELLGSGRSGKEKKFKKDLAKKLYNLDFEQTPGSSKDNWHLYMDDDNGGTPEYLFKQLKSYPGLNVKGTHKKYTIKDTYGYGITGTGELDPNSVEQEIQITVNNVGPK